MFKVIDKTPEDRGPFITTTSGISGHFAVQYWWNPEGFWEPWDTGMGRYLSEHEAKAEATLWAEAEGLPVLIR